MVTRKTWLTNTATTLCILFLLLQACAGSAPTEYELKAAFLYQFASFVEWPGGAFADSSSPLVIGVLGSDPFGSALDDVVKGKTVNGRRLIIKRYSSLQNLQYCHILYISSSEKSRLSRVIDKINGWSTLSVSDIDGFARQGGIIGFVMNDSKITLQINTSSAKRSKLQISSKLLRLARIVGD